MASEKWLINWIEEITTGKMIKFDINLDGNIFDWIDSFDFIRLIADIEDAFGVELDIMSFDHTSFSTINEIATFIDKKSGENHEV